MECQVLTFKELNHFHGRLPPRNFDFPTLRSFFDAGTGAVTTYTKKRFTESSKKLKNSSKEAWSNNTAKETRTLRLMSTVPVAIELEVDGNGN